MKMYVEQFYNKNQFVIKSKESVVFQSYQSVIATIEKGVLTLGKRWDYSNTTQKHLYLFLRDYYYNLWSIIKDSPNKRKSIQKLIDNKEINYDEELM